MSKERRHRRAKRPKGPDPVPGGGYATRPSGPAKGHKPGRNIVLYPIRRDTPDLKQMASVLIHQAMVDVGYKERPEPLKKTIRYKKKSKK